MTPEQAHITTDYVTRHRYDLDYLNANPMTIPELPESVHQLAEQYRSAE
ncbi:MAG TPA: hypothetical protein VFG83_07995 [Kofleriaceae bacterium]|nr:hypothetical protein [Kofleriaceae bacterium]